MATVLVPEEHRSGFNFANTLRNLALEKKGWGIPKAVKTGTTIAGVVFDGGVVLGADSRATAGTIVADKECMKLYKLAPNMFAAGAGTAADMEHTCKNIRAQLELHRLNTGRTVPVICAVRIIKQLLFKYQGHVSAYFIVGGVDHTGPHLYEISASGCSQTVPFCSTGSGCLAALSQLESQWKMNMTEEQAKGVMKDAILAGIMNDLGSGSTVNIAVIRKDTVEYISPLYKGAVKGERPIFAPGTKADVPSEPTQRFGTYRYMKGTTAVLSTRVIPLEVESSTVHEVGEAMETS